MCIWEQFWSSSKIISNSYFQKSILQGMTMKLRPTTTAAQAGAKDSDRSKDFAAAAAFVTKTTAKMAAPRRTTAGVPRF
jgi:hypothetical protein